MYLIDSNTISPFNTSNNWQLNGSDEPMPSLRLGTVFSGIGAIEQALKRLNINHTIEFAGDIDNHVKKAI